MSTSIKTTTRDIELQELVSSGAIACSSQDKKTQAKFTHIAGQDMTTILEMAYGDIIDVKQINGLRESFYTRYKGAAALADREGAVTIRTPLTSNKLLRMVHCVIDARREEFFKRTDNKFYPSEIVDYARKVAEGDATRQETLHSVKAFCAALETNNINVALCFELPDFVMTKEMSKNLEKVQTFLAETQSSSADLNPATKGKIVLREGSPYMSNNGSCERIAKSICKYIEIAPSFDGVAALFETRIMGTLLTYDSYGVDAHGKKPGAEDFVQKLLKSSLQNSNPEFLAKTLELLNLYYSDDKTLKPQMLITQLKQALSEIPNERVIPAFDKLSQHPVFLKLTKIVGGESLLTYAISSILKNKTSDRDVAFVEALLQKKELTFALVVENPLPANRLYFLQPSRNLFRIPLARLLMEISRSGSFEAFKLVTEKPTFNALSEEEKLQLFENCITLARAEGNKGLAAAIARFMASYSRSVSSGFTPPVLIDDYFDSSMPRSISERSPAFRKKYENTYSLFSSLISQGQFEAKFQSIKNREENRGKPDEEILTLAVKDVTKTLNELCQLLNLSSITELNDTSHIDYEKLKERLQIISLRGIDTLAIKIFDMLVKGHNASRDDFIGSNVFSLEERDLTLSTLLGNGCVQAVTTLLEKHPFETTTRYQRDALVLPETLKIGRNQVPLALIQRAAEAKEGRILSLLAPQMQQMESTSIKTQLKHGRYVHDIGSIYDDVPMTTWQQMPFDDLVYLAENNFSIPSGTLVDLLHTFDSKEQLQKILSIPLVQKGILELGLSKVLEFAIENDHHLLTTGLLESPLSSTIPKEELQSLTKTSDSQEEEEIDPDMATGGGGLEIEGDEIAPKSGAGE